ncbi:hypothetical protein SERLA73DRAFT_117649 [Serpula lacrymans var. lacrymans S7.3]|uniref:TPR-like protein n=2 Tax=Serpula lacrymans var. lacrymans TaxID=341189 RepID=F8QHL9_SERL3|nr:uncharacterized protein SERLADRAFT_416732 [Serpula lacrymans var. lacrymans S7.9]EGN92196.1 hypothetical protein SERLA73DRAFT_117649 [Serpula lacrymans var. lacrymans S7.3]EGO22120.1 hypothetical protein SERLADRAFT_416732 [Serpula lacrymans var. lacrymans S7.9]
MHSFGLRAVARFAGVSTRTRAPAPPNASWFCRVASLHTASTDRLTSHTRARASKTHRRWATSTTPQSSTSDPADAEAMQCLEQGTQKLEEGDVQAAKALYKRSVDIKRNASSLFNLGVTHYHLKEFDEAITAWKESIALQPASADAHTNLASAYIISPVSRPDLALHHLQHVHPFQASCLSLTIVFSIAASLSPEDPEIAFNLAAVLEATGQLEEALKQYTRSKEFGVERAVMHIRNVSAKILGQKMKAAEDDTKKSGS